MNAEQVIAFSKNFGIVGTYIKTFRNKQELREYILPNGVWKIRAFNHEHNI